MAVDVGHLHDDGRHHRVKTGIDPEQIAPEQHEPVQVLIRGEIKPAGKRGQRHAEQEDVGDFVVMAEAHLPGGRPGQIDRSIHGLGGLRLNRLVRDAALAALVGIDAQGADDVQPRGGLRLNAPDGLDIHRRCLAFRAAQREGAAVGKDHVEITQRRDPSLRMQGGDLLEQRQHQDQHVVGRQAGAGLRFNQRAQRTGVFIRHDRRAHALTSLASWRL